jgi:hypothetical protein
LNKHKIEYLGLINSFKPDHIQKIGEILYFVMNFILELDHKLQNE